MLLNTAKRVSVDVGDTLGRLRGRSIGQQLVEASPLPRRRVEHIVRTRLHSAVTLTPQALRNMSDQLQVESRLLEDYQSPSLELLPAARPLLERCRALGVPVVIASNSSELDRDHAVFLRRELGDLLAGIYVSHEVGTAKPDRQFFERIARDGGIPVSDLLHVGDRFYDDIQGALSAGASALHVKSHPDLTRLPVGPDRYRSAVGLEAASDVLHGWLAGDPDIGTEGLSSVRPTLAARAEVLIVDDQGNILCTRDPNDDWWTLPGGRQETYGLDSPSVCAAREVLEELGLHIVLGKRPDSICWARAEDSGLGNKIIHMYRWQCGRRPQVRPNRAEVAEYDWFDRVQAARVLHPRAEDRVWNLERGISYFEQY